MIRMTKIRGKQAKTYICDFCGTSCRYKDAYFLNKWNSRLVHPDCYIKLYSKTLVKLQTYQVNKQIKFLKRVREEFSYGR